MGFKYFRPPPNRGSFEMVRLRKFTGEEKMKTNQEKLKRILVIGATSGLAVQVMPTSLFDARSDWVLLD